MRPILKNISELLTEIQLESRLRRSQTVIVGRYRGNASVPIKVER